MNFDYYSAGAARLLNRVGLAVVLEQALDALTNVLHVTCSTELEAAELRERASTEKLKDYWRGRQEGAWSVRRHADQLEPIIRVLWKLVPATSPSAKSSREDLKKLLKKAKALGRPPRDS